jgi:hypothetical protein
VPATGERITKAIVASIVSDREPGCSHARSQAAALRCSPAAFAIGVTSTALTAGDVDGSSRAAGTLSGSHRPDRSFNLRFRRRHFPMCHPILRPRRVSVRLLEVSANHEHFEICEVPTGAHARRQGSLLRGDGSRQELLVAA